MSKKVEMPLRRHFTLSASVSRSLLRPCRSVSDVRPLEKRESITLHRFALHACAVPCICQVSIFSLGSLSQQGSTPWSPQISMVPTGRIPGSRTSLLELLRGVGVTLRFLTRPSGPGWNPQIHLIPALIFGLGPCQVFFAKFDCIDCDSVIRHHGRFKGAGISAAPGIETATLT